MTTITKLNQAPPPAPTPDLPKAYLIDSSIYVFRGWHMMPHDLEDQDGNPVNAVHGFLDFLIQIFSKHAPSHIVCAFDQSLRTDWRRDIYPEYKANRPPAPEELKRQFSYCRELVQLSGIPWFASDRYEADDIIGTFSRAMTRHGFQNIILTADKDLTQLVSEHDIWWDFARNKQLDYRGVEKHWGVKPEQIADLLALTGDKVDNIPGIPGVGNKTAANLLKKFGDVETLLQNIDAIGDMKFRGAVRTKNLVKMHSENARIAKQLTIIKDDPDIVAKPETLQISTCNYEMLNTFMDFLAITENKKNFWLKIISNN